MRDNRHTCHAADGQRQGRVLTSGAELRGVLEETFGIDFDGLPGVDGRLAGLISSSSSN